jgi:hypothetical protein
VLDEHGLLNDALEPGILFGRGLRLLREAEGGRYAIFLSSVVLFEWAADDRATRRLVAALNCPEFVGDSAAWNHAA